MNSMFKNQMFDSNDMVFAMAELTQQQYNSRLTKWHIQKHFTKNHELLTLSKCCARRKFAIVKKVSLDYSTDAFQVMLKQLSSGLADIVDDVIGNI